MNFETDEPTFFETLLNEFPANKFRWSKTQLLTLHQALFLSYGLEPPEEYKNPFMYLSFEKFLYEVDIFSIYNLSEDAVRAGTLRLHNCNSVKAEEFVNWAESNNIAIETDFFYKPIAQNTQQDPHQEKPGRRDSPETMRKQIARWAALLHWRKQEKEGVKEPTRPTALARNPEIRKLVEIVNKIGGLEPLKGDKAQDTGIDPE